MSSPADLSELEVELSAEESDAEELDQLTQTLQQQLLELDVESVERPTVADAPPGSRAVDVAAVGMLIVTLAKTAPALASVVGTIRSWLSGARGRSITIKVGDDSLVVTGASSEDHERLISAFIARHGR
jgi:hypothetical protein